MAKVVPNANQIIQGEQSITIDLAIRIGKAMGNGPQLWLNLQQKVEIREAININEEAHDRCVRIAIEAIGDSHPNPIAQIQRRSPQRSAKIEKL